jgi:hypothetical protein
MPQMKGMKNLKVAGSATDWADMAKLRAARIKDSRTLPYLHSCGGNL